MEKKLRVAIRPSKEYTPFLLDAFGRYQPTVWYGRAMESSAGKDLYQNLYFVSDDEEDKQSLKVGDYCMFYGQPSLVLEEGFGSAKIKTFVTLSEGDAAFSNEIRNHEEPLYKAGDESTMVHSFGKNQLPKIMATTDKRLWTAKIWDDIEDIKLENPTATFLIPQIGDEFIKKFCYEANHKDGLIETVIVECYEKDWQVKFEGSRKEFNEYLERRDMREDESIKPYPVGKSFAYHAITNHSILKTTDDNEVIIKSFE